MSQHIVHGTSAALQRLLVASLLLTLFGCSSATGGVAGKVKLNDQPVKSGMVVFVLGDDSIRMGAIQPDGNYRIERLPVGRARIMVQESLKGPFAKAPPAAGIPKRYGDPDRSKLTCDVHVGEQTYNIDLEP
jgi:hypothetical protein